MDTNFVDDAPRIVVLDPSTVNCYDVTSRWIGLPRFP